MSSAESLNWCPLIGKDCVAAENPVKCCTTFLVCMIHMYYWRGEFRYHKLKIPQFLNSGPTFDASPCRG